MRLPRLRFTVRQTMVAVAVVAMVVYWLRPANRPRPSGLAMQYGGLYAIALTADAKWLATGGRRPVTSHQDIGVVSLRDLATGRPRWVYEGDDLDARFESLQFSADGKTLFGLTSSSLRIWEVANGRLLRKLQGPPDECLCESMTSDAALVAWATKAGIRLQDVASGEEIKTILAPPSSLLAFSPDAKLLASARGSHGETSESDDVMLWDLNTGKPKTTLTGHSHAIGCLAFSPDGRTLAAGGRQDGSILLWDIASGRLLTSLKRHARYIRAMVFSPSSTTLASLDSGGLETCDEITFWDVKTGKERDHISTGKESVECLLSHPSGSLLLAGCLDGTVLFFDSVPSSSR
jgi:WD40 repeat protein